MMNEIRKAIDFADRAHISQKRKFTGTPYIVHPMRVWMLVAARYPNFIELQQAALLHDTIEDCNVLKGDLVMEFGPEVADLVVELTNVYNKEDYPQYNRAKRKELEFERIKGISPRAKLIKLADRIDNLGEMPEGEDFTHKYLDESVLLADVLRGVDSVLEEELDRVIAAGFDSVLQGKLKGIGR